jgi:hypothetical protein
MDREPDAPAPSFWHFFRAIRRFYFFGPGAPVVFPRRADSGRGRLELAPIEWTDAGGSECSSLVAGYAAASRPRGARGFESLPFRHIINNLT